MADELTGTVAIQCLGQPTVARGPDAVRLSDAQRHVLAVLVAVGPDGITTDQLLDELYGEDIPSSGRQSLYQMINRLKPRLDDRIESAGGRYRLAAGRSEVDVWSFLDGSDGDVEHQTDALERWTGAPYAGVEMSPLVLASADDLVRTRSRLVERLCPELDASEWARVERQIHEAANDDPFNETLAISMAAALFRLGRQSDALDVVQRCRAALRDDLGLEAGAALEETEVAILQQNADALAGPSRWRARPGVEPRTIPVPLPRASMLVGRGPELDQLATAMADISRGGPGRIAIVRGEAGAGKSELVSTFLLDVMAQGVEVHVGSGGGGDFVAYEPFVKALPSIVEDIGLLEDSADPAVGRLLFWQAIARRLSQTVYDQGPTLLLLEDMHFADSQSQLLLQHLASAALPAQLLIVVVTRPEPGSTWADSIATMAKTGITTIVDVPPLTLDHIEALVTRNHPTEIPRRRHVFARQVLSISGGNALVASSLCDPANDVRDLATESVRSAEQHLSDSLSSRVPRQVGHLLGIAGLMGIEFSSTTLESLSGESRASVLDALEEAMRAGLITEVGRNRFRFEHILTADAFTSQLSQTRRADFAAVLAAHDSTNPADAVRYVRRAEDALEPDRAIEILDWAAGELEEAFMFVEASSALETIEELLAGGDGQASVDLLTRIAASSARAGDLDAAERYRHAAFDRAKADDDMDAMCRAAMSGLPSAEFANGDHDRFAMLSAIDAERLTPSSRAHFYGEWANHARLCDDMDTGRQILADVDPNGFDSADDRAALELTRLLFDGVGAGTTPIHEPLTDLADSLEPGPLRAEIRLRSLFAALIEQRPEAGTTLFDATRAEMLEHGAPRVRWWLDVLSVTLDRAGIRQSPVTRDAALANGYRLGIRDAFDAYGAHVWLDLWLNDRLDEALGLLDVAAAGIHLNVGWRAGIALSCAAGGDEARARDEVAWVTDQLITAPEVKWNPSAALLLVEAAAVLGDVDAARIGQQTLAPHSGHAVLLGAGASYFGPADHFIGKALVVTGDGDPTPHLDAAIEQTERTGSSTWRDRIQEVRNQL